MPPQLQSKFVSTYARLLQTPATVPPTDKRFWDDVFCLSPDSAWLRDKLTGLGRPGLLGTHQHVVTAIFSAARVEFCADSENKIESSTPGKAPVKDPQSLEKAKNRNGNHHNATSELRRVNAARTLQAVAQAVLDIPGVTGWEIMDVLAGGVGVSDEVFTELVRSLASMMADENASREMRHSALQLTLALTCGLRQLSPGAYFLAQDMFPAIVSLIWSPTTARYSFEALLLLAVLANYHRVDAASLNPYLKHIRETRDEVLMQRLLWVARFAFTRTVKAYRDLYDDTPPSFTSTVTSIFSVFRPTLAATEPPPMKEIFSNQPIEATVILLPLFEFLSQNQAFRALFAQSVHPDPIEQHALRLSSSRPQSPRPPLGSPRNSTSTPLGSPRVRPGSLIMVGRSASMTGVVQKAQAQAQLQQNEVRCAAELMSMASYVLAHAGTTGVGESRAEAYAKLVLDSIQQCVSDEEIIRAMCSPPTKDDKAVWICRQKLPHLPLRTEPAPLIRSVLDACVLYLRHNLSKRLECGSYLPCLNIIHHVVFFLQIERVRIDYYWDELWRAIIAVLVFILAKQDTLAHGSVAIDEVIAEAIIVLDLAVARADGFLPSPESVHQLVYETVRASSTLRDLNKRKQNTKFARGLQDLLMTIDFYESQLEGTRSADDVMRVLAREIEKDGVHGVSAREREEPGAASDLGDVAFVRWACADGLALVS
ncbi:hypothetical protein FRC08_018888 [Ceratobasidium sp. 394]|nr:hypothetical protein FRC08_018888 [Ceratobasidium sp. 394]KAG9096790.1 hypothetical protein FS749_007727 [Ceratobasidium sp. UAMH 11750]